MKRKFLAFLLTLAIVLPLVPTNVFAAEIIKSGECGENITWELDSDGWLAISGSGEMQGSGNFAYQHYTIKSVTIENGITAISPSAFLYCSSLKNVTIPDSITTINARAFESCGGLEQIYIPNSVTFIGSRSFYYCVSLVNMVLPSSVSSIESFTFSACYSLSSITIPDSITYIGLAAFADCFALNDIYYTGTEEEWKKIIIEDNNEYLANATIHFNSDHPNNTEYSGSVRLFTSWEAQNQVAYFGMFDVLGCKVTEKTDTSFLANVGNLIGKYVWVESEPVGNGIVDSDILLCIKEVETRTGTVTQADATTITIDGIAYITPQSITLPEIFEGELVQYYLSLDGELLGLELTNGNGDVVLPEPDEGSDIVPPETDGGGDNDNNDDNNDDNDNDDINDNNKPDDGKDDSNNDNTDAKSTFNESIYRADYLLSNAPTNLNYYVSYVNKFSPSQIFLSSGNLESNSELWRKVTLAFETADDVSNLAKFQFDQSDVYTSILINALEKQTNRINAIDPTAQATVSTVKTITSRVLDILKQTHNLDIAANTDYRNLPAETKKKVQEAFIKTIKDDQYGGALLAFGDATKLVSNIMKEVNCIEDFVNRYTMYAGLFEVSDSMGTVLEEMYNQTPNTAEYANMRNSIKFCMDMLAETEEEFYNKAINAALFDTFGKTAIQKAISAFYDRFKEKAILANPELGVILCAYKLSSTVINGLLNVDDIAEKTYKMSVINEYYIVLNGAITSLVLKYNKQPTEQNAEALLNSLELLFGLADIDCDTASSFVNSVDDAFYNKVKDLFSKVGIGTEVNYDSVKNYISSTQREFSQQCKLSKELWLNQLQSDYPDIYRLYVTNTNGGNTLVVPITKSYTIQCPVYIYVYDKANNLVAFIDEDRIYASGNITISLIEETKIIDFFDNEEYTVVCKGYDTGTMDITVTEYSEGVETRKSVFYELEITDGVSYQMKTNSFENTVMRDDTIISADFDSKLNSEADKHHIVIENGYIMGENGIVFEIDAHTNSALEISAYVPDGFVFVGWEIDATDGSIKDTTTSTTTLRVPSSDATVRAIIKLATADNNSDTEISQPADHNITDSHGKTSSTIIWIIIPLIGVAIITALVVVVVFIKKKKS